MITRHLFLIDTSCYAGNFERQMCAYLTGRVGECGKGQEMADLYLGDPFDNVIDWPDEDGCTRPVTIWSGPNGDMNTVAIIFLPDEPPTAEQIEIMKRRALAFVDVPNTWGRRPKRILGFRLLREVTTYEEVELQ